MSVLIFLALGCAPKNQTDTSSVVEIDDAAEVVAHMAEHLTGSFNSAAQAAADPSYYNISLIGCPVDAPELGDTVLYIEQAVADTPNRPYRQRLYVLEAMDADEDGARRGRSVVYSLIDEESFVGGCNDGGGWTVTAEEAEIRVGCEVVLREEGDDFVGGTIEDQCTTTLYGATYATSEVTLSEDLIESWDRGWYDDGTHAWGATDGAYRFDRVQ